MSTNESLIDQLIREKRDRPATNVVGTVKDWYKKNVGAELPLSNIGATDFHKKLRLEHSRSFDVGLDPRTREGQRLIGFLDQQGIPYLAFDRAIAGTSTGPHIHVGPPSQRGVSLVDRLLQEKEQFEEIPTETPTRPPTAAERRGEYGRRGMLATHPEKNPQYTDKLRKLAHDINWHFGYSVLLSMPTLPVEKQQEIIERATQYAREDEEKKKKGVQIVESQLWKYRNQDLVGIREGKEIEVRQPPDVAAEMDRQWKAYENPLMRLPDSVRRFAEPLISGAGGLMEAGAGITRLATLGGPNERLAEPLQRHAKQAREMAAESQELSGRRKGTRIAQGVGSGLLEFAPFFLAPELGVESALTRIGTLALRGGAYTGTQAVGRGASGKEIVRDAAVGGASFGLMGIPLPGKSWITKSLSNLVIVGGGTTIINRITGQPLEDAAIHGLVQFGLNVPAAFKKVKVQEPDGTERPATERDIKGLLPAARFEIETVDSPLPSTLTTRAKGAGRVFTEAPGQQELFSGIAKPVDRAVGRADLPGEFPPVYTFEEFALSRGIDLTNPQNLPMKQIDIRLEPLYNAYREAVARGGGRGQGTVTETIPGRAVLDYGTFLHGFFGWVQGQGVDPVRLAQFPALLKKAADHYATNVAGNGDTVRTLAATYNFEPTQMIFPLPGALGETRAAYSGGRKEAPEVALGDATLREVASLSPEQQQYRLAELLQRRRKPKNISVQELAKIDRQIAYLEQVVETLPAGPEKGVARLSEQTARSNLETLKALREDKPTWNALNKKQKEAIEAQIKRYEEQSVGDIPAVEEPKVGDRGTLRYTIREQLDPSKVRLMHRERAAQQTDVSRVPLLTPKFKLEPLSTESKVTPKQLYQRIKSLSPDEQYVIAPSSMTVGAIESATQNALSKFKGSKVILVELDGKSRPLSVSGEASLANNQAYNKADFELGHKGSLQGFTVKRQGIRETPEQRATRIAEELRTENLGEFIKSEKGSVPDLDALRLMLTGKQKGVKELGSVERKRNVRPQALWAADEFVREQRAEQEHLERLSYELNKERTPAGDVIDLTGKDVDFRSKMQQFLKDEEGSFKPEELKKRIQELLEKNPNLTDVEIKALLRKYKEPIEERHAGIPLNIFKTRTPPDMPTAPKSLLPEVEARMKAAEGIQTPGMLQKTKEAVQGIYHSFKRTYPELDPNKSDKNAVVNDLFRRHEATPMYAKAVAFNRIAEITENLGKNRMQAFSRALILPDILKDIQEGRYKDKELPFGLPSEAAVRADLAHYESVVKSEPAIQDAMQRRQQFVQGLTKELVDAELLSPEVLKDPRYYHRQVMEHVNDPAWIGTGSQDLRMHQKGFQKSRKGGGDFNTRYQEAEFEWVSQALSLLERKKTLKQIKQVADIKPDLEAQAALWNKTNVDKKTWRDFIPADYAVWQPKEGGHFYPTLSMTERTMNKILSGSKTLEKGDLRRVLAMGKRNEQWVVPEEIARTMDDFRPVRDEGPIERTWTKIQSTWKQAVLLLPTKVLKYNFNNLSGDLDIALAYDPKILKYFRRSAQDVWQHQVKGRASAEIEDAIRKGVVDSGLTLTEVPDINKAGAFRALASTNIGIVRDGINAYWSGVRNFTAWRENILRLSAYRYFKERLNKGDVVYGASNKEQIDAIRASQGNDVAAAKLARELVGDYGAVSTAGRWIRRHLIPFYSWIEINAPRYVRMIKNLPSEGGSPTGALASKAAAVTGRTLVKGGALAIKAQLLMLAAATWNHTMFPKEEEELRKESREPHLILGRSEDGSIRTIRLAGALADALDWFNVSDYPSDIADLSAGRKTPKAMVAEGVEAPIQKTVQSLEPVGKTAFEVATGRTTFPTVFGEGEEFFDFKTRPIRDRKEYIARVVALDELYRRVTKRPAPPTSGGSLFDLILTKRTDPGEAAYWEIRGKASDWAKKQGRGAGGGEPTERSNALYYYRQAVKWKDEEAAKHWLQEYKRLGGTEKGMTQSLRMGHPLGMLKASDDKEFKKTLSFEQQQMLEMAVKWYEGMYGKNLSREVRQELR